jgi:hypothetical protein
MGNEPDLAVSFCVDLFNHNRINIRLTKQLSLQAEQIKRLTTKVAADDVSTRRELAAQRSTFERRLAMLEQVIAANRADRKLVAALDK